MQEETASSVAIVGVNSGETYDLGLQSTHPNYLSSPATAVNAYHVIGREAPPDGLRNLIIAAVAGQALLRWNLPDDRRVIYNTAAKSPSGTRRRPRSERVVVVKTRPVET